MTHDPMCRKVYQKLIPVDRCTDCDLIERVRADERKKVEQ
jgi:hypothetical protein